MQAGHTVIAVEDIYSTTSDSISSFPSEIQNPNLPTYNTLTPELFLDNDLLEDDNTPPEEESDNEPASPTILHNQRFHTGAFNIDGYTDFNTCYNKFLFHHRLPSFSAPQTIGTFLQNIREHFSTFYSNQYIRITVKQHPYYDSVFTEGHIYLPHENILPDHTTFIPLEELSQFYKLELKSSNSSPLTLLSNPTYFPLNLSICTHNICGFNQKLKQQVWEDYCLTNNLDIISLTETKLAYNSFYSKPLATSSYIYF